MEIPGVGVAIVNYLVNNIILLRWLDKVVHCILHLASFNEFFAESGPGRLGDWRSFFDEQRANGVRRDPRRERRTTPQRP